MPKYGADYLAFPLKHAIVISRHEPILLSKKTRRSARAREGHATNPPAFLQPGKPRLYCHILPGLMPIAAILLWALSEQARILDAEWWGHNVPRMHKLGANLRDISLKVNQKSC